MYTVLLSNFFARYPGFTWTFKERTLQIIRHVYKKCRLSKNIPNIKKIFTIQYSHINVLVFLYVYCTLNMILISFEICNTPEIQTLAWLQHTRKPNFNSSTWYLPFLFIHMYNMHIKRESKYKTSPCNEYG